MEPLSRRAFTSLSLGTLAYLVGSPGRAAPPRPDGPRLVCLWLHGGPSQLETFDPKPGLSIGGPTRGIETSVPGVQIAEGLPQTAEQLHHLALVRSMVSQEGDHERGNLFVRSGYRPDVTLEYPTLGALLTPRINNTDGRDHWPLRLLADKLVELGVVESISHETIRRTMKKTI